MKIKCTLKLLKYHWKKDYYSLYSSAILHHSTELQGSLLINSKKSSVKPKREYLILQSVITTFTQKRSVHFKGIFNSPICE